MSRSTVLAVMTVLLAATAQQASATNLLVNGGFETPVQGPPNYAAFNVPAGSNLITGWTVTQGNVDLTNAADYGPGVNTLDPTSVQDIDLIGDSGGSGGVFGGLSQSFSTVAGQLYQLSFDYSHNNGTYSPDYAALVSIADGHAPGDSIFSTEVSQAYGPSTWAAFTQTFTASSDLTSLSFTDTRGAYNAGLYLDSVSVEPLTAAVPEPATWALMLLGVGLTGMSVRRRRDRDASAALA